MKQDAPDDFKEYAFKKIAADFALLAHQLGESRIVLCGHDWYIPFPFFEEHLADICTGAQHWYTQSTTINAP